MNNFSTSPQTVSIHDISALQEMVQLQASIAHLICFERLIQNRIKLINLFLFMDTVKNVVRNADISRSSYFIKD